MAEETTPNEKSQKSNDAEESKADQKAENKSNDTDKTKNEKKDKSAQKGKKSKKEKEPPIEEKPFPEFIEQHFTPALQEAFTEQGVEDLELDFVKEKLPVALPDSNEQYWQVVGSWQNGQRQFNLYFLEEDIKGQKAFSYATSGSQPSTVESFMIDERKVNLDLLVLYTLQRLNGQKWLTRN